jgi:hypothetical protein
VSQESVALVLGTYESLAESDTDIAQPAQAVEAA